MQRATTRYAHRRARRKRNVGTVAVCVSLRHSACVATRRLRTATYSTDARQRLAAAVATARAAEGHRWRPSFAAAAGISLRSLTAIETAEPTVGQAALDAVGAALAGQGWDKDTPKAILEGGPIPTPQEPSAENVTVTEPDSEVSNDEKIRKSLRDLYDASPDEETFYRVVAEELARVRAARDSDTHSARPTAEG